jgi:hypothetical protein
MNAAPAESQPRKWPWTRWLAFVAVVFAAHVALIFIFGARKPIAPKPVENAPSLTLAGKSSGEWLGLNNSTLFALPSSEGFAGTALTPVQIEFRRQEWTEPPRWLQLSADELGAAFDEFMQTNRFVKFELQLKTPPQLTAPVLPAQPAFAPNSTLQIKGEIAGRPLLRPIKLQSWPDAEVIAPSIVQVLVDAAGNVVSAVLLPPENFLEVAPVSDPAADQHALELARAARFAPASPTAASVEANPAAHLAVGKLIFNWQTVPPSATNAP